MHCFYAALNGIRIESAIRLISAVMMRSNLAPSQRHQLYQQQQQHQQQQQQQPYLYVSWCDLESTATLIWLYSLYMRERGWVKLGWMHTSYHTVHVYSMVATLPASSQFTLAWLQVLLQEKHNTCFKAASYLTITAVSLCGSCNIIPDVLPHLIHTDYSTFVLLLLLLLLL